VFAHTHDELKPVLRGTGYRESMCRVPDNCPYAWRCRFAHSLEELRSPGTSGHFFEYADKPRVRDILRTMPAVRRAFLEEAAAEAAGEETAVSVAAAVLGIPRAGRLRLLTATRA
jgi:hypothetical protein